MKWKVKSSEIVLQDQWIKVRADQCEMPDGTIVEPYYVLDYPNWANALALTKSGKAIVIEQYRHGMGEVIYELPGGNIDPEETPLNGIRRELLEETGYVFEEIIQIAVLSPNPANHSNKTYSFLALGGKLQQQQQLETYEQINVHLLTLEELQQRIAEYQFPQAMHVATVLYGLQKLATLKTP